MLRDVCKNQSIADNRPDIKWEIDGTSQKCSYPILSNPYTHHTDTQSRANGFHNLSKLLSTSYIIFSLGNKYQQFDLEIFRARLSIYKHAQISKWYFKLPVKYCRFWFTRPGRSHRCDTKYLAGCQLVNTGGEKYGHSSIEFQHRNNIFISGHLFQSKYV